MGNKTTPLDEQETCIVIEPLKKTADVYSCVPNWVKKINKLSINDEVKVLHKDSLSIRVEVPQSWITIKPPCKRKLSEEQKAAARERMMKAQEARKNKKSPMAQ